VKTGATSQPILSKSGQTRLTVGNWTLMCKKDGELQIQNSDGQQVSLISLLSLHIAMLLLSVYLSGKY